MTDTGTRDELTRVGSSPRHLPVFVRRSVSVAETGGLSQ